MKRAEYEIKVNVPDEARLCVDMWCLKTKEGISSANQRLPLMALDHACLFDYSISDDGVLSIKICEPEYHIDESAKRISETITKLIKYAQDPLLAVRESLNKSRKS